MKYTKSALSPSTARCPKPAILHFVLLLIASLPTAPPLATCFAGRASSSFPPSRRCPRRRQAWQYWSPAERHPASIRADQARLCRVEFRTKSLSPPSSVSSLTSPALVLPHRCTAPRCCLAAVLAGTDASRPPPPSRQPTHAVARSPAHFLRRPTPGKHCAAISLHLGRRISSPKLRAASGLSRQRARSPHLPELQVEPPTAPCLSTPERRWPPLHGPVSSLFLSIDQQW
jgi:hypothetical protein